jgi:hypothetical protein
MRYFSSYKEAHEQLHLPGSWQRGTQGNKETGITSLKLTANPKSLDKVSKDLTRIYYVGRGEKGSPGEPIESQRFEDQEAFQTSLKTQKPIPILVKVKTGLVIYLGNYKVIAVRRVPAFTVSYYQITLVLAQ